MYNENKKAHSPEAYARLEELKKMTTTCKNCNRPGLHWVRTSDNKVRLAEQDDSLHLCKRKLSKRDYLRQFDIIMQAYRAAILSQDEAFNQIEELNREYQE